MTATDLQLCYNSVAGKSGEIEAVYNAVVASKDAAAVLAAAQPFGEVLGFFTGGTGKETGAALFKMMVIWLKLQQDPSGTLAIQAKKVMSPQCSTAFDELRNAFGQGNAVINDLRPVSENNPDCTLTYYKETSSGIISLTVCNYPISRFTQNGKTMTNMAGYLTNYGSPVCGISFDIASLSLAQSFKPDWLPNYPNAMYTKQVLNVSAFIPSSSINTPISLKATYKLCPITRPPSTVPAPSPVDANTAPKPAPSPAAKLTPRPTAAVASSNLAGLNLPSCYQTQSCNTLLGGATTDICKSYARLLRSDCHMCPVNEGTAELLDICNQFGCGEGYCESGATVQLSAAAPMPFGSYLLSFSLAGMLLTFLHLLR